MLARILKALIPKLKPLSEEEIQKQCFVDEIYVGGIPLDQDAPSPEVSQLPQEDNSIMEGRILFDLLFKLKIPHGDGEYDLVYINMEQQLDYSVPYPVVTRAIYHLAREISRQKNHDFEGENYQRMRKCYSIWICPNSKGRNYIARYRFTQEVVVPSCYTHEDSYDKMEAIICAFEEKDQKDELLGFLEVLFSAKRTASERISLLEARYGFSVTPDFKQEVSDMCNFSDAIVINTVDKDIRILVDQARKWRHSDQSIRRVLVDHYGLDWEKALFYVPLPEDGNAAQGAAAGSE